MSRTHIHKYGHKYGHPARVIAAAMVSTVLSCSSGGYSALPVDPGDGGLADGQLSGTVPANGTIVVDLNSVLTSFAGGAPRATLVVNVAGPNNQIQGLYQIVNPDSGSISNHVMVRPGTN